MCICECSSFKPENIYISFQEDIHTQTSTISKYITKIKNKPFNFRMTLGNVSVGFGHYCEH